jgi:hypothetical protein
MFSCRHVSAGAAGLDQTDTDKWLEECATVLDGSGFRHLTSIMSGASAVEADKNALESSLSKIEVADLGLGFGQAGVWGLCH